MWEVSDFVQMWAAARSFHAGVNRRKPKYPLHVIEFPPVYSVDRRMLRWSGLPTQSTIQYWKSVNGLVKQNKMKSIIRKLEIRNPIYSY